MRALVGQTVRLHLCLIKAIDHPRRKRVSVHHKHTFMVPSQGIKERDAVQAPSHFESFHCADNLHNEA